MVEQRFDGLFRWMLLAWILISTGVCSARLALTDEPKKLDPASWGTDHVGQPIPEYVTGDQCLFCHREKIGAKWGVNRHHLTMRPLDELAPVREALMQSPASAFVEEIKYIMGGKNQQRFLKTSTNYGHLQMLSMVWKPPGNNAAGQFIPVTRPHWNEKLFGDSCAGCHATAVDSRTKAFSSPSLDCFVCHGNVAVEHANQPELAHFSVKRKKEPRVEISICAQCHVRGGKSKSTGLPYPNNFVAGDNIFRDFEVDFTDQNLKSMSIADRHVLENVRDVVVFGKDTVTCTNCHDIHGRSSKKHHHMMTSSSCWTCHDAEGFRLERKPFTTHSKTCGY